MDDARLTTRERAEAARETARDKAEQARETVREAWQNPRLTFRRLSGLDRSGPPPPQTLRGAPLNPWTIPNAIGYLRALLIPVFLYLGFTSGDGVDGGAAAVFAVVAWSDYADGIAARVTGQYSRLGALMDPVIDRLLVVSGLLVCWHYELLPRWALAVLVARELFMLWAGRAALRRGLDLKVNMVGRLGVWPVMSAVFAGLVGWQTAGEILIYLGLVLTLWATAIYVRDTRAQLASRRAPSSSA